MVYSAACSYDGFEEASSSSDFFLSFDNWLGFYFNFNTGAFDFSFNFFLGWNIIGLDIYRDQ